MANLTEYHITCVIKPDRYNTHEHITHLGDYSGCMKRETVIRMIDAKTAVFYTVDPVSKKRNDIYVVHHDGNKAPYLRTHSNGTPNDNLLSLPECSGTCKIVG